MDILPLAMIFLSELTIGAHLPANKNSFASFSIAHKHLSIKLIHLDELAVCRLLLHLIVTMTSVGAYQARQRHNRRRHGHGSRPEVVGLVQFSPRLREVF